MENISISLNNSKLGATIPSINLPPLITCRKNTPCAKGCYALKGHWLFPNVKNALAHNLQVYKDTPIAFFDQITDFLKKKPGKYSLFRFHASGDIVDAQYLEGMVKVATENPLIKFLAFTKKFELVNEYVEKQGRQAIPANLRIVFSAWDKNFVVPNPNNFPVTYVYFKDCSKNPEIPELAIPCTGSCPSCACCWGLNDGQCVMFHQH